MTDSLATLADVVNQRIDEGYRRVKLKIGPGWDREPISLIRAGWPDLAISVDANGAYSPDQNDLPNLDGFNLQYIEQPYPAPDVEESARLAESIATPICLDESLTDRSRVHAALARHPGFVINAKPSRLGGHTETLAVHRLAQDEQERARYLADPSAYAAAIDGLSAEERDALVKLDQEQMIRLGMHPFVPHAYRRVLERAGILKPDAPEKG